MVFLIQIDDIEQCNAHFMSNALDKTLKNCTRAVQKRIYVCLCVSEDSKFIICYTNLLEGIVLAVNNILLDRSTDFALRITLSFSTLPLAQAVSSSWLRSKIAYCHKLLTQDQ